MILITITLVIYACGSSDSSSSSDTTGDGDSTTDITNSIGMKFVLVEKGAFQMGSTTGYVDESPIHTVTISNDFYAGKYEVTNSEVVQVYNWAKTNNASDLDFMVSNGVWDGTNKLLDFGASDCDIIYSNGSLSVKSGKDNYPCIEISWYGAKAFADFLNQKENVTAYRLLTEAEWEYAARGGTKSKGYTYSGSNSLGDVAWYGENSGSATHQVATKQANELGIYDMSGNVYEWVQDYYLETFYSTSSTSDPKNTTTTSKVVLRGGAYDGLAIFCRATYRDKLGPANSDNKRGFRIVKTIK